MAGSIAVTSADAVAVVTLNRPERRNAVDSAMLGELWDVLDQVDKDNDVRAVVLTGAGDAFCAGADISSGRFGTPPANDHIPRDSAGVVTLRMYRMIKPIVAAVNGTAVGFGASVILPADFRVIATDARIGFPFARRGITPDGASSWFLPRLVGVSTAMDWMLSGRLFGAAEARDRGLATEVVERDNVLARSIELAQELAAEAAPAAAALTRHLLWNMTGAHHPGVAHQIESAALAYARGGIEATEGVAAFLERRTPSWPGELSDRLPSWFPWSEEAEYTPFAPTEI